MERIAIIDIDGVLVDYPNVFLEWVEKNKGILFTDLNEMKNAMSVEKYESIKKEYRDSGIKRVLPIKGNAKEILELLKQQKWKIWVVTSRPDMCPVNVDTKFWLDNNLPYDKLIFMKNKKKLFDKENGIKLIIDDNKDFLRWVSSYHKQIFVSDGNWQKLHTWILEGKNE